MWIEKLPEIQKIVKKFSQAKSRQKNDGSPVTELDIALSEYLEAEFKKIYPNLTFYSEENFGEWKFPLVAVDPLDGTREFIKGIPEWAISLGIFDSEVFQGQGWVCNPETSEVFTRGKPFVPTKRLQGEVSRSEWEAGLYQPYLGTEIELAPMGSIAYKLARLSAGETDFVVSLWPKNIWDIAGGTLLCQESGLKFYSKGKEVTRVLKLYEPPLVWCHPSVASKLLDFFA